MRFEYEIGPDEFVAAQLLYYKLSVGRKRFEQMAAWIVVGVGFIVIGWREGFHGLSQILLAGVGAACIYRGAAWLNPASLFLRAFRKSDVAGKWFKADANAEGFEVMGDLYSWRVKWPAVRLKAENEHVFMLYSQGTVFMFGKKYLTHDQQQELRKLSGLASVEQPSAWAASQ